MIGLVKKHKKFLLLLFAISFFIRALVFYGYLSRDHHYWQVDSHTYHKVALQIADGEGITNHDGSPHFYRLPGYPLFLGLCYKIFGESKVAALWIQVLLASLIPILIFFLSLVLFPSFFLLARVVSLYSCVHLGLVLYSGFFMTESLFLFFFLIFLILFFSCMLTKKRPKNIKKSEDDRFLYMPDPGCTSVPFVQWHEKHFGKQIRQSLLKQYKQSAKFESYYQRLLFAGLALGVASLVRPVGHYLMFVTFLLLLFFVTSWQQKFQHSFLIFLGWFLPISFWLLRNLVLTGHLFFHTLPGGHFLYLSAARVAMHVHDTSYQHARKILEKNVTERIKTFTAEHGRRPQEIEDCTIKERLALEYFFKAPLITLKHWMTDMFRTMFSLYSAELLYLEAGRKDVEYFEKGRSWQSMFERYLVPNTKNLWLKSIIWSEIALYLFVLLGFLLFSLQAFASCNWLFLYKLGIALPYMMLFIVISLAGGYARMRLPVEPLLLIFSFAFWVRLFEKRDQ